MSSGFVLVYELYGNRRQCTCAHMKEDPNKELKQVHVIITYNQEHVCRCYEEQMSDWDDSLIHILRIDIYPSSCER